MSTSKVTVIAGPTAVGKGTVIARLRERFPQVELSISMTTRSPRPGEVDGVHYHFVSEEEFLRLVDSGQMLEWALVHGKYHYGTPRGPVDDAVKRGVPFLLEIDIAGVHQVRESLPDAQFVFLAPPSWEELVARLVNRGTEDAKYALVIFAARRARQINSYNIQLEQNMIQFVGPVVDTEVDEKPLAIALREIDEGLLTLESAPQA